MRTIVMTGGSSGFGRVAVQKMTAMPDVRVCSGHAARACPVRKRWILTWPGWIVSARSPGRWPTGWARPRSTRFVLNAGRVGNADGRTVDGFGPTFAVNHLAHYLLVRLLLPQLADGAVVVLTTSGTHDPAERASLPLPRHADARLLANPELDPDRDHKPRIAALRAYTSSKLCAVLTARALAAQPEARPRHLTVVAYCPGVIHGTGLMRENGRTFNLLWRALARRSRGHSCRPLCRS